MNDTSPEIARLIRERLMQLSGEERLRMAASMFESARHLVLASLPASLTESERRRELCRRLYGLELPG